MVLEKMIKTSVFKGSLGNQKWFLNALYIWCSFTLTLQRCWPIVPVLSDTTRALGLLEDYCSKLKKPEEQQLRAAIQRVVGIFRSSLFQALIGQSSYLFAREVHKHSEVFLLSGEMGSDVMVLKTCTLSREEKPLPLILVCSFHAVVYVTEDASGLSECVV